MNLAITFIASLLISTSGDPGEPETRADRYRRIVERHDADESAAWDKWRIHSAALIGLAREEPRDATSAMALFWVVEQASAFHDTGLYGHTTRISEIMGPALDLLLEHQLDDPRIGSICLELARIPSPLRDSFLGRVLASSRSREARGRACLAMAEYLAMKGAVAKRQSEPMDGAFRRRLESEIYDPSYFLHLATCDPAGLAGESDALFDRALREYGDVPYVRNVADTAIGRRYAQLDCARPKTVADEALARLRVSVGRPAPEIEGKDVNGIPFKLSDHRGKVVLLTFSGNWCAPCKGRYPEERELVRQMANRPFAMLSVSTDETPATLGESTHAGEITWRCWWDGLDGPICNRWNVQAYPTMFIIDAGGVIRETNIPAGELAKRIEPLLTVAP